MIKDKGDTDHRFAVNIGLNFYTPEMLFLGRKEKIPDITLEKYDFKGKEISEITEEDRQKFRSDKQEIILFVGPPGSGKSTFWQNYFSDYERVNMEEHKKFSTCMNFCNFINYRNPSFKRSFKQKEKCDHRQP